MTKPKKTYQTNLDDGPLELVLSSRIRLAQILSRVPSRNIRLQVRGNNYRAQVRFYSSQLDVMKWVKRTLGLTTAIHRREGNYLVTITKRSVVQEILKLLLEFLSPVANTRATNLLETLSILDSWRGKMSSDSFPPPRLVELARLLY